ncbi:unnamed protein product [Periconia digitata]|uniref:Uncharacterized protein n=1 Tax=Periconia digitata TaxID=1303443 RepID=A0A9W4XP15_9PLEO|nr:unnamed protein product [Periconia digitata]
MCCARFVTIRGIGLCRYCTSRFHPLTYLFFWGGFFLEREKKKAYYWCMCTYSAVQYSADKQTVRLVFLVIARFFFLIYLLS